MGGFALVVNSLVPVRAEPDDRAEMETQLLFGDAVRILDDKRQWRLIENVYDGYQGWIDEKSILPVDDKDFYLYRNEKPVYVRDLTGGLIMPDGTIQTLVAGSRLPFFENGRVRAGDRQFTYLGEYISGRKHLETLFALAEIYLNAPYLWGGNSPFGIDCSGLTQMLFRTTGLYRLPRNASQQVKEGKLIDFPDRRPGDLAFFADGKGKIIHVGLVWEGRKILHAHGRVRLDTLQVDGIWNEERGELTHTLAAITRVAEEVIGKLD